MGKKLTKNNKKKVPRKRRITKKKYLGGVVLRKEWFKDEAAFEEAKRLQTAINNPIIRNDYYDNDYNLLINRLEKFKQIMNNKEYINTAYQNDPYFQAQQKQIERAEKLNNSLGKEEKTELVDFVNNPDIKQNYDTMGKELIASKNDEFGTNYGIIQTN